MQELEDLNVRKYQAKSNGMFLRVEEFADSEETEEGYSYVNEVHIHLALHLAYDLHTELSADLNGTVILIRYDMKLSHGLDYRQSMSKLQIFYDLRTSYPPTPMVLSS